MRGRNGGCCVGRECDADGSNGEQEQNAEHSTTMIDDEYFRFYFNVDDSGTISEMNDASSQHGFESSPQSTMRDTSAKPTRHNDVVVYVSTRKYVPPKDKETHLLINAREV